MQRVARAAILILKTLLIAALVVWICAAPIAWILRDGLGPDMVESAPVLGGRKFLVGWGTPALLLILPLIGLSILERRLAPGMAAARHDPDDDPLSAGHTP